MEAPDTIYINYKGFGVFDEPVSIKMQASQIEYVRADVFLEKAEKFLKSYRRETTDKTGYISRIINDKMIKDFKNYMKGE